MLCPACGFEIPDDAAECGRCHLSAGLFGAVREAVGTPSTDPEYVDTVVGVLEAVDASGSGYADRSTSQGRILRPSRFPTASGSGRALRGSGPRPLDTIPRLPALGSGSDQLTLRQQLDEYLLIGRRQGIDLTEFTHRAKEGVLSQNRELLESVTRELFVYLAASLSDEHREVLAKRDEVTQLLPTPSTDAELEDCRLALSQGDLATAQRLLRHLEESLNDLEDHWATVQILITEADLLAETIRELGGDPAPALGPLEEGRRLARLGRREEAEPVLARSTYALWSILNPLFTRELDRVKDQMIRDRDSGGDVSAGVGELRHLALNLRRRNFAAAVAAYRRLRELTGLPGHELPDARPEPRSVLPPP